MSLVVLLLRLHRPGEADIAAREFGNNCTTDQNLLIEDLLDAYDQNDGDKVRGCCTLYYAQSLCMYFLLFPVPSDPRGPEEQVPLRAGPRVQACAVRAGAASGDGQAGGQAEVGVYFARITSITHIITNIKFCT